MKDRLFLITFFTVALSCFTGEKPPNTSSLLNIETGEELLHGFVLIMDLDQESCWGDIADLHMLLKIQQAYPELPITVVLEGSAKYATHFIEKMIRPTFPGFQGLIILSRQSIIRNRYRTIQGAMLLFFDRNSDLVAILPALFDPEGKKYLQLVKNHW